MQQIHVTRNVLLLAVAGCLAGPLSLAAAQDGPAAPQMVRRSYDLPEAKASAFFELLAPSDVKVLVGRTDKGVSIEGTTAEAKVLDGLTDLLTRFADRDVSDTGAFITELRPTWTTTATYELPEKKLGLLFDILAFDDVPVLVSRGDGKITVQASDADQKVVAGIARILSGERLTDEGAVVQQRRDKGESNPEKRRAGRRGARRERPPHPRRPRAAQPPTPPPPQDATFYEAQLKHMKKCHQLIDRIHHLRGERRDLQRMSLRIQQDLEKLNEELEQLSQRLDEAEATLNIHLKKYHSE